jgi:hypothetical protein
MKRNIEDNCGYVYIMTNHCYPNLIKIGQTIKKPDVRANELSKSTGVIGEFVVEWFAEVPNRKFGEILGHNLFKKKQFQKEFFNLEVDVAITGLKEVIEKNFLKEEIVFHIPPKPISKFLRKKPSELEMNLFDNELPISINEFSYIDKKEEIRNLRWKLLYCPEKYFEEIFEELQCTCGDGISLEDIEYFEKRGIKSYGYIYIPISNSFSKWLFNNDNVYSNKRPIYTENLDEENYLYKDEQEAIAFILPIPYSSYELKSKYADLFISVLRKYGITCHYKIEETLQHKLFDLFDY